MMEAANSGYNLTLASPVEVPEDALGAGHLKLELTLLGLASVCLLRLA